MQRLLRSVRWDADAVRDDVRAYVLDHLGTDNGVLIVDRLVAEVRRQINT